MVFPAAFRKFVFGEYLTDIAETMDRFPFTIDIGPRKHFKSMRLYARILHNLNRYKYVGREGHYFSYNSDLSAYHLTKVKKLIRANPYFRDFKDLKPTADSILEYSYRGAPAVTYHPQSILGFKRGIHGDDIFIDDPLRDPENKLAPLVIHKINRIIRTEILPMVNKESGELRVVGTPQTWEDFFFDKTLRLDSDEEPEEEGIPKFHFTERQAIVDEAKRIVLWPEWRTYDDLVALRNLLGEGVFKQEYQATPVYAAESYIPREELDDAIDPNLEALDPYSDRIANKIVFAAWDLGKKAHPGHFSVFEAWYSNSQVNFQQLLSKWFDHVDYQEQLDYVIQCAQAWNIDQVCYDNTRGELEGFVEQGLVPHNFVPVVFNMRTKNMMATQLGKVIRHGFISFLNDKRQRNQILAVTNDLNAMESAEGHGDAFWSAAMAVSSPGIAGTYGKGGDDPQQSGQRQDAPLTGGLKERKF